MAFYAPYITYPYLFGGDCCYDGCNCGSCGNDGGDIIKKDNSININNSTITINGGSSSSVISLPINVQILLELLNTVGITADTVINLLLTNNLITQVQLTAAINKITGLVGNLIPLPGPTR